MRITAIVVCSAFFLATRAAVAQPAPLEVRVILDRTAYPTGTPITVTVRVHNTSSNPVSITFPTSQRIELTLISEAGLIDRLSRGRAFGAAPAEVTWAPGETREFIEQWIPRNQLAPGVIGASENPVDSGFFGIVAEVTGLNVRPRGGPASLVIGRPVPLATGCTTLPRSPFPSETPILIVAATVEPSSALASIWQQHTLLGSYQGFAPSAIRPSDLTTVNRLFPLTVCLTGEGQITLP